MTPNKISFEDMPTYVEALNDKVDLILKLLDSPNETIPKPLDIEGASKVVKLSVSTIYGLTSKNKIPFFRKHGGKRLWFWEKDLINWLSGESLSHQ
jgi:predicted DNA-binding transcriptional regulator AlpA